VDDELRKTVTYRIRLRMKKTAATIKTTATSRQQMTIAAMCPGSRPPLLSSFAIDSVVVFVSAACCDVVCDVIKDVIRSPGPVTFPGLSVVNDDVTGTRDDSDVIRPESAALKFSAKYDDVTSI